MSRPATPTSSSFIPPLHDTTNSAPEGPRRFSSDRDTVDAMPSMAGYSIFNSPHNVPFEPDFNPSSSSNPEVMPGSVRPPVHLQYHLRHNVPADWTGYPEGTPYPSPSGYSPAKQLPPHAFPVYGLAPSIPPWYSTSVPVGYAPFGKTPWGPPPPPLPTQTTRLSPTVPSSIGNYDNQQLPIPMPMPQPERVPSTQPCERRRPEDISVLPSNDPNAPILYHSPGVSHRSLSPLPDNFTATLNSDSRIFTPPPHESIMPEAPEAPPVLPGQAYTPGPAFSPHTFHRRCPGWGHSQQDAYTGGYFGHQPLLGSSPEPSNQAFEEFDQFAKRACYGPVLDPYQVQAVRARIQINPLILSSPESGSERVHLKWNILFPASTVQLSTNPPNISWSKGREAPATFPRLTELNLVSDNLPWMIHIYAQDKARGITCGEVIDGIVRDLAQLTKADDFQNTSPQTQKELSIAHHHNRSQRANVPGGQPSEGMRRFDFLRKETIFAGVEADENTVKRICGEVLPCVFILKRSLSGSMTPEEILDEDASRKRMSERDEGRSQVGSMAVVPVVSPRNDDSKSSRSSGSSSRAGSIPEVELQPSERTGSRFQARSMTMVSVVPPRDDESQPSNQAAGQAEKEKKFNPMILGQPLQNPLHPPSEIDSEPFTMAMERQQAKHKTRCQVWKEEVENLLIFSGLFSAVVTAFIIESYKGLRQDTGNLSNILLLRILVQLEGGTNGTTHPPSTIVPAFSPASSDVRVNILWFLSLILSLTTVLVGIIALQWLREHLRSGADLEPQIAFSLRHLEVESIDRWYLPQIFTALPLLIQLALVLFLLGVIEFLWSINHTVTIPIAVAVGFSLLFLLGTTVLPTIQALSLFLPRWLPQAKPRSPCPYRSPQSWAFHELIRPLVGIILKVFRPTKFMDPGWREELVSRSMTSRNDRYLHDYNETDSSRQKRPTNLIFRQKQGDSWVDLGIAWLFQRDLDVMQQDKRFKETGLDKNFRPVPVYDTVQAVLDVGAYDSSWQVFRTSQCVEPILRSNRDDRDYMKCLYLLLDRTGFLNADHINEASPVVLNDHIMLSLYRKLNLNQRHDNSDKTLPELFIRFTQAMFAEGDHPLNPIWAGPESPLNYCDITRLPDGREQLISILSGYFQNAAAYHPDAIDATNTTYFSGVGASFVDLSAKAFAKLQPTSPLLSQHDDLLRFLLSRLRDVLNSPATHSPPPDYLFFASFAYVKRLLDQTSQTVRTEIGRDLILAILEYRAHLTLRQDIEGGFYNSIHHRRFDWDWQVFVDHANGLDIVLPPPAGEQPAILALTEGVEIREEPHHPSSDAIIDLGAFGTLVLRKTESPSLRSYSPTEEDWATT